MLDDDAAGAVAIGGADRRRGRRRGGGRALGRPQLEWPGKRPVGDLGVASHGPRALVVDRAGESGDALLVGDNSGLMRAISEGAIADLCGPGQVKLAYLDPPYNTGSRFGHYDDALQSAEWLSDLHERLALIKRLLHEDGSVWLHLDDSEQHRGRCLLDEVFGSEAFVATIIWQRRVSRDNRTAFSASHDYIHVYAPGGPKRWKLVRNGLPNAGAFVNPDDDPRGPWRSVPLSAQAGHGTASQFYEIMTPRGTLVGPPPGRCWTYTAPRFQQLAAEGRIYWPKGGLGRPRLKRYVDEVADLAPSTLWLAEDVGDTATAKKELLRAVGGARPFDTPKPEALMERIIHIATDPGDLVLDPYLGSGTTAVVASRMSRPWVGIERQAVTVATVTLPRLAAASAPDPSVLRQPDSVEDSDERARA